MRKIFILCLLAFPFYLIGQVFPTESIENVKRRLNYIDDPSSKSLQKHIFYSDDSLQSNHVSLNPNSDRIQIVNPQLSTFYNSKYNYGYNDGPIWKGKGLTSTLFTGFQGKFGNLYFTVAPYLLFSQNSDFQLANTQIDNKNKYNYQFNIIGDLDFVQRYGDASFTQFYPGQTELRFKTNSINIGFSTANYTIGPSVVFPLLMSNQGLGIPRFEIGTNDFIELSVNAKKIGSLDANITYGLLEESSYFDNKSNNNQRYFTSLSLHYMIPSYKTLILGINRVFYTQMKNFQTKDLFRTVGYYTNTDLIPDSTNGFSNDLSDQIISFDLDWIIDEADLRLYVEFARNDFFGSSRDLFVDLEHSRAYNLGIEKNFNNKSGNLLINYEFTNLSRAQSFHYRLAPTMYLHYIANQGYTHQGQLLGAGIGPGSNSHHFSIAQISDTFILQFLLQRVQFDNDYLIETYSEWPNFQSGVNANRIFVEYSITSRIGFSYKNLRIAADLAVSKQLNFYYQMFQDRTNFQPGLSLTYNLNHR